MTSKKVIVLGLDGATWDFILPLIQKGELKTFESLLRQSIAAPLRSTMPPTTIPAWQSMFSGLSPEKLGITDFFKIVENKLVPVTSKDIKGKMLWDLYPELRFMIYNIPGTYPAYKINGILISTPIGTWNSKSIYPSDIKDEIERIFTKNTLYALRNIPITKRGRINQLYAITKAETELFKYLYTKYESDIFIFRYEITDYIAHWAKNKEEIEKAYTYLDKELKKLLSIIDLKDTYLLIVSDHGVSPASKDRKFFINSWLLEQGYLKLNPDIKFRLKSNSVLEKVGKFLIAHGLVDKVTLTRLYTKLLKMIRKSQRSFTQSFIDQIDIKSSKAYAYTSAGGIICIRLEDISIVEDLSNKLLEIMDDDGIPPIINVLKRTFNRKLEIVAESHPRYSLHHEIVKEMFLKNVKSFTHSSEGIFMIFPVTISNTARTKNINGLKNDRVNIFDVMPMICYLIDVPIPKQIDGRVPMELFNGHSEFANKQPKYIIKKTPHDDKIKKVIMRLKKEKKI